MSINKSNKLSFVQTQKKTKKGHIYFVISRNDIEEKLHGLGLCDSCSESIAEGNLIVVLNSVYCKKCFDKWKSHAKYYEEDREYESEKTEYYKKILMT